MTIGGDVEMRIVFQDVEGHDVLQTLGVLQECVGRAVDLFEDAITELYESRRS